MIAGLSESTVRRQVSDSPALVFTPQTDRRTVVNLSEELKKSHDTLTHDERAGRVTSTGTNTTYDIVVTEDQGTETGRQHRAFLSVILSFV